MLEPSDQMLNEGQERLCQVASRTSFDDYEQAEIYKAMKAVDPDFLRQEDLRNNPTPGSHVGGGSSLKEAATFLLWHKDRGKNTDDAVEAWDALRAALSVSTPADLFAAWLSEGPRLAKDAGCYVGIRVTDAPTSAARAIDATQPTE